jgi:hypothetical protein
MPQPFNPDRKLRGKLNLTIHPEIRDYAEKLSQKRRRSVSQLFEDLVEAEWMKLNAPAQQPAPMPIAQPMPTQQYYAPQPFYTGPTH